MNETLDVNTWLDTEEENETLQWIRKARNEFYETVKDMTPYERYEHLCRLHKGRQPVQLTDEDSALADERLAWLYALPGKDKRQTVLKETSNPFNCNE
ncbi:MAG: hypothetical protein LBT46_12605 [Planctomycetaceae bacterium]|jgi:hypothetical protein|nr:hypothetical protein [Planctomycetaceae bacterium]